MTTKRNSVLIFILFIMTSLIIWNYERIKFEYYIWHLSSEVVSEREEYSNRIFDMGRDAIPFLIDELDHPYIFETYYIVENLEKLVKTNKNYPTKQTDQVIYWKNWWLKNKQNFK